MLTLTPLCISRSVRIDPRGGGALLVTKGWVTHVLMFAVAKADASVMRRYCSSVVAQHPVPAMSVVAP